ncbi:MAG: efflux RND transporter permease subunit [Thermoleophilia bacterium]
MIVDRIAGFIVSHNKRVLAVTALLTLLAAAMLFRMSFNADVTSFMKDGSESGREYAALQEKYSTDDPINVLVRAPEGRSFRQGESLAELLELSTEIDEIDGVGAVASVVPAVDPFTGTVLTPELVRGLPETALAQGLLSSPLTDLLLSDDSTDTLLMVVPTGDSFEVVRSLREWVEARSPGGLDVTLTGNPVVFETVFGMLTWFLLAIPPVVVVLLLGTFYANIGDRRLTVMAVIPAILGSLWTFGVIFGLGIKVDIVTILVPIYVIVMGSADGLHFVTHFQEEAARTDDAVERVATTLRQVGLPMILTTVSTAAGFLSLLVAGVRPIQQLGLFTAVGITFAGIISFFFLPALLSRARVSSRPHAALVGPRLVRGIRVLAVRRWVAVALTIGLLAFAVVFIPRLQVDSDQLFMFKGDHQIRQDFARMQEALGGATPLVGEFAFDPGADPATEVRRILAASREMEALPGVREVFSAADIAAGLAERSPELAAAALGGDVVTPLGDLVSDDGMRFVLFPGHFSTADLRGWLDYAAASEDVRVLTGVPVIWDDMARLVLRAQFGSLGMAFLLVVVMLFVAYRRVRETLVALAPLVLTIGVLLGFIAAAGIQLNLVTAIVSSIVLGVGIDYAIHFIAAIDYARSGGPGYVLRAVDKAGRPIVANALGIAIGLTGLWLSPFAIHGNISMIMWVSMSTAALTALVVIPALMPREGLRD